MIFINIENGRFRPTYGQSKKLDDNFDIQKNFEFMNEYTKQFIETHQDDIYVSLHYDYNATEMVFLFNELHTPTDEEYEMINNAFDADVDVKDVPEDAIKDNDIIEEPIIEQDDIDHNKTIKEKKSKTKHTKSSRTTVSGILSEINKKYPCPSINDGFYIEKSIWNYIVRNILKHKNMILFGPTGTGKTDIIIRVAKALNLELNIYDMGAMIDPLTDLLGTHRLINGSSVFDYAKFVSDVQKPGIILLDELSRAPLMTNNILFPCLDHRRTLNIEIAGSTDVRHVDVHPDCIFIATANIGQEYSGTNDIDAALMNRFNALQVDYLPQEIETKVLNIRTGISEEDANKLLNIANAIRNAYLTGTISKPISTRETLEAAELLVDGFKITDVVNLIFCQKFSKSDNNEYSQVKKLIMGF